MTNMSQFDNVTSHVQQRRISHRQQFMTRCVLRRLWNTESGEADIMWSVPINSSVCGIICSVFVINCWRLDLYVRGDSVCCVCERWTTTIRLPLKSDMKKLAASRTLAARFHDIQPSLLLFLHRLRSITICNQVPSFVADTQ